MFNNTNTRGRSSAEFFGIIPPQEIAGIYLPATLVYSIYETHPQLKELLSLDLEFRQYIKENIKDKEFQNVLLNPESISYEQDKILDDLMADEMFVGLKQQKSGVDIKKVSDSEYKKFLINEYRHYKKPWFEKIKLELNKPDTQDHEEPSFSEARSSFYRHYAALSTALIPLEKLEYFYLYYLSKLSKYTASCAYDMKCHATRGRVLRFIAAHALYLALMPIFMASKSALFILDLPREMLTLTIITVKSLTMTFAYLFRALSNGDKKEINPEKINNQNKVYDMIALNIIYLASSIFNLAFDIFIIPVAIPIRTALGSLSSLATASLTYYSAYVEIANKEKEIQNKEKEIQNKETEYNIKLKAIAEEQSCLNLKQILNNDQDDQNKFISICKTTKQGLENSKNTDKLKIAYRAISILQGSIGQLKNCDKLRSNRNFKTVMDVISDNGALAIKNGSIKETSKLNHNQKEAVKWLIKFFDSIIKQHESQEYAPKDSNSTESSWAMPFLPVFNSNTEQPNTTRYLLENGNEETKTRKQLACNIM